MKVSLVTAPQNPLGTLFYVWKQSRHNKPLPSPSLIENLLKNAYLQGTVGEINEIATSVALCAKMLGFTTDPQGCVAAAQHVRDEIRMILHESIPVTENLHFVFHLENIPISLREQLVRHRIGTSVDMRVGADIVPMADGDVYAAFQAMVADLPAGSVMNLSVIPDLAESTWWSQTSRVINQGTFYKEGRFVLPESLAGKEVSLPGYPLHYPAEWAYRDCLEVIQNTYNALVAAGVHIEDARQLIPVGATHGITWGLNLKAMLHIFGKRSSWIAQIGIWGDVMGQMADELVSKVHPMFRMVLMPQCVVKGKYVGCPVNGTNVERIQGTDGMPPCPLWVRYQTADAMSAYTSVESASWQPPVTTVTSETHPHAADGMHGLEVLDGGPRLYDVREWRNSEPVEREMLERTAAKYSRLWGFNIFDGIPEDLAEA